MTIQILPLIVSVITGDEVTDQKIIACSYIKGRFILDLIAAVPFELIQKSLSATRTLSHLGILTIAIDAIVLVKTESVLGVGTQTGDIR